MPYLRCPECRLTAPAAAYYLRGDQCPRCLTTMEPAERFRESPVVKAAAVAGDAAFGTAKRRPRPAA